MYGYPPFLVDIDFNFSVPKMSIKKQPHINIPNFRKKSPFPLFTMDSAPCANASTDAVRHPDAGGAH